MLNYIYHALGSFSTIFSRHRTWLIFVTIVLGFMGTSEMIGVSSLCRFWGLDTPGYHSLLHFFRSQAWSLQALISQWFSFVLSQQETVVSQGRMVLLGDHTYVPKDARRMPGVVTLHQESQTQTKPSYFRGQCWGAIGVVVGSITSPFCLPLWLQIHQGLKQIDPDQVDAPKNTLGEQMVMMAQRFALESGKPCILVLDAFFSVATVFNLAHSLWGIDCKLPLVHIITRAKKNYVAYFPAPKPLEKKQGRPKKYGDKLNLVDIFEFPFLFSSVSCEVYGKTETISILSLNLLWKPTGSFVKFVFAITSIGPIILMCSDLEQDPIKALELYCCRIRIETMFEMLKNLLGSFRFRFWSKSMPRQSRTPKRNSDMILPSDEEREVVKSCWDACERFVMLGAIALGLLQLVSLKYTLSVWGRFDYFLRTRSRALPSERTVKQIINTLLIKDLCGLAPHATMQKIRHQFFGEKFDDIIEKHPAPEDKIAA